MTSLLVTKTLFANKINTIAVFAVLEATIIFQKYCSAIQRAKYGTLGRFGLIRLRVEVVQISDFLEHAKILLL